MGAIALEIYGISRASRPIIYLLFYYAQKSEREWNYGI